MSNGSPNQTNRLGHGVASGSGFCAGQVSIAARPGGAGTATEVSIGTILASIFASAGQPGSFAPFQLDLLSDAAGLEVRSATTIAGYPLQHVPAGLVAGDSHGAPLTIYFNQNGDSPNSRILIANTTAVAIIVNVMAQG
jgi:hypothetical protein